MKLSKKNLLIAGLAIAVLCGIGLTVFYREGNIKDAPFDDIARVIIGSKSVKVELADTADKRILGLSGRSGLEDGKGLLFVFDSVGKWGFWMKDMLFPIDIVWFNEKKEIVYVRENVSPDTYPQIFTPTSDAQYVVEVPAGFFKKTGAKIGDTATFVEN